jgi:hypothetical protein
MNAAGRLDIVVAGETWRPVRTLDGCGPDDGCYVLRIEDDGAATVTFGDGRTGRRPPSGASIGARYNGGETGNTGDEASKNPLRAMLDLIAEMLEVLERELEQVYADSFIETSGGRIGLVDVADLRAALADGHGELVVRMRVRPRRRPRRRPPT